MLPLETANIHNKKRSRYKNSKQSLSIMKNASEHSTNNTKNICQKKKGKSSIHLTEIDNFMIQPRVIIASASQYNKTAWHEVRMTNIKKMKAM